MRIDSKAKALLVTALSVFMFAAPVALAQEEAAEETVAEAAEEESPFALELNTDFATDYMFRGQNSFDGTSIQPSVDLSYSFGDWGTVGGYVWSHLSGESAENTDKFTEIDYQVRYELTFDPVTIGVGNLWYTYPDNDDEINDTPEFFVSLSVDTLLSPTFTYYHDYKEFDYDIYELGLSQKIEADCLGKGFNVTPSINFGFASNADKVYEDNSGLMYVETGLSFDMTLGVLAVTPSFNYTFKVDEATVDEFWFKVGIAYSL
jgi:hypothetical protein